MKRRSFLQTAGLGGTAAFAPPLRATPSAEPPAMKITRVRFYLNPNSPAHFNQSYHIVTAETGQGIKECMKIQALCETHYVGLIPRFTGPISEAALVYACGAFSGPVLTEMLGDGSRTNPHLPECHDFRNDEM